jgi:hypothetical protein
MRESLSDDGSFRKQFGDYYAKELWRNDLPVLDYLDLTEDEDMFSFEMHCTSTRVYDAPAIKSPKEADHWFQSDRFWTKKWQMEFRQRCRERISSANSKKSAAGKQRDN